MKNIFKITIKFSVSNVWNLQCPSILGLGNCSILLYVVLIQTDLVLSTTLVHDYISIDTNVIIHPFYSAMLPAMLKYIIDKAKICLVERWNSCSTSNQATPGPLCLGVFALSWAGQNSEGHLCLRAGSWRCQIRLCEAAAFWDYIPYWISRHVLFQTKVPSEFLSLNFSFLS